MRSQWVSNWELSWSDENVGTGDRIESINSLEWRPVTVPCSIQNSPFGLPIQQLYQRDHIRSVSWMASKVWLFRTQIEIPDIPEDHEAVVLFKGIDYRYRIFLDNHLVIDDEGMFSPVEVPLSGLTGRHELLVELLPVSDNPGCPETLKAGYCRGHDFVPAVPTRGLWDDVCIVVRERLRVTAVNVATHLGNQQRADVRVGVDLSEPVARGEMVVDLAGVRRVLPLIQTSRVTVPVEVPSPALWWPNGSGPAHRVPLRVELRVPGRQTCVYERLVLSLIHI